MACPDEEVFGINKYLCKNSPTVLKDGEVVMKIVTQGGYYSGQLKKLLESYYQEKEEVHNRARMDGYSPLHQHAIVLGATSTRRWQFYFLLQGWLDKEPESVPISLIRLLTEFSGTTLKPGPHGEYTVLSVPCSDSNNSKNAIIPLSHLVDLV